MTAVVPTNAETDLSFLLDHTSHALKTRMTAALAEIGLTPRMQCVLVHALEEERTQIRLAELGDMDKTTMFALTPGCTDPSDEQAVPRADGRGPAAGDPAARHPPLRDRPG